MRRNPQWVGVRGIFSPGCVKVAAWPSLTHGRPETDSVQALDGLRGNGKAAEILDNPRRSLDEI